MRDHTPNISALDSINLNIWERAVKPRLKKLTASDEPNLSDNDLFAWLLQQAGRLQRGEFEKSEVNVIITLFNEQAQQQLREGRFQLRELMMTLVILCSSPRMSGRLKPEYLEEIANRRYFIQKLLRDSPSLIDFLDDMQRFAWHGARTGAINTLSIRFKKVVWEHQIPENCPFGITEVLAYDPYDRDDYLIHTKSLPMHRFHP